MNKEDHRLALKRKEDKNLIIKMTRKASGTDIDFGINMRFIQGYKL